MPISPARRAAFDILLQVGRNTGHASDLLAALPAAKIDRRDLNLATELVMGCLRRQNQLDHLISVFAARPTLKLDAEVAVALRLGVYQMRYLDRVPRHAVVDDSVSLTKAARKLSASGLVNAVLRKVHVAAVEWPTAAVAAALPEWLWSKWRHDFGEAAAEAAAEASVTPPATYLRVPPGREEEAYALGAESTLVPGCFRLPPGAEPGPFRIQDIGSQTLVPLLDLAPGHRFLDACAAPGNKTLQALETPGLALVVAADHSVKRLHALNGVDGVHPVALDATRPLPFSRPFDRILADAPCSGTGTLARNPEIRWRVQREDLMRHRDRQMAILRQTLTMLAPGGLLVYSTCSLEREENETVVEETLAESGGQFALEKTVRRMPGRDPGDGFFAAVIKSKILPGVL